MFFECEINGTIVKLTHEEDDFGGDLFQSKTDLCLPEATDCATCTNIYTIIIENNSYVEFKPQPHIQEGCECQMGIGMFHEVTGMIMLLSFAEYKKTPPS